MKKGNSKSNNSKIIDTFNNSTLKKLNTLPKMSEFPQIHETLLPNIVSHKTGSTYKIIPGDRGTLNSYTGAPMTLASIGKFIERQKQKDSKQKEDINQLEYVPIMWQMLDVLNSEMKKYFNEVECLRYYANEFEQSRKTRKRQPNDFIKEKCLDKTLDINHDVDIGEYKYIGLSPMDIKLK
jgi:hypothetical protein